MPVSLVHGALVGVLIPLNLPGPSLPSAALPEKPAIRLPGPALPALPVALIARPSAAAPPVDAKPASARLDALFDGKVAPKPKQATQGRPNARRPSAPIHEDRGPVVTLPEQELERELGMRR